MTFYQIVCFLILLLYSNFGLTIWSEDPRPKVSEYNTDPNSGALHYHCSESVSLDANLNTDFNQNLPQKIDYDFSLVYMKRLNDQTHIKDLQGQAQPIKEYYGYEQKMKTFLFLYGQYSMDQSQQTTVKNLGLQTLSLSTASEIENFKKAQSDQENLSVTSYIDMIGHFLGFEEATLRESLESGTVYYVGVNIPGHGFLGLNELFTELSGRQIYLNPRRVIISLEVPVDFAHIHGEPETFRLNLNLYDITLRGFSLESSLETLLCKKESDLSEEDLSYIQSFSGDSIPKQRHKFYVQRETELLEGRSQSLERLIDLEKLKQYKNGIIQPSDELPQTFHSLLGNIVLKKLREMADAINQNQIEFYTLDDGSLAVYLGSALLASYRVLGRLAGKQKLLSLIIPPEDIRKWLGRTGYRVPENEKYDVEDIKNLAGQIASTKNKRELITLLQNTDQDLLDYFQVVIDHIEEERTRLFHENCLVEKNCV